MSKKKGDVKRLNEVFAEIGLESIPEGTVTRLDAISMLEDSGNSLQMQNPHPPAEISETCGKACYASRQEVRAVIKHRKAKGSGPLRDYLCPDCGHYHITSYILHNQ